MATDRHETETDGYTNAELAELAETVRAGLKVLMAEARRRFEADDYAGAYAAALPVFAAGHPSQGAKRIMEGARRNEALAARRAANRAATAEAAS